jgi:hypothetical protein
MWKPMLAPNEIPTDEFLSTRLTEGTPITQAFATPAELVEHLATKGTDWDHGKPWDRHSAEQFVKAGWAMSAVYTPEKGFKTVEEAGFYDK